MCTSTFCIWNLASVCRYFVKQACFDDRVISVLADRGCTRLLPNGGERYFSTNCVNLLILQCSSLIFACCLIKKLIKFRQLETKICMFHLKRGGRGRVGVNCMQFIIKLFLFKYVTGIWIYCYIILLNFKILYYWPKKSIM